jgi:hypothetical protein
MPRKTGCVPKAGPLPLVEVQHALRKMPDQLKYAIHPGLLARHVNELLAAWHQCGVLTYHPVPAVTRSLGRFALADDCFKVCVSLRAVQELLTDRPCLRTSTGTGLLAERFLHMIH